MHSTDSLPTGAETTPLLHGAPIASDIHSQRDATGAAAPVKVAVYPRRYWMLFLLSAVSCMQCAVWMTFSPCEKEVLELYGHGWTSGTLDLLAAWGPIAYLPACLVAPRVVRWLGLRACIAVTSACICAACVLRAVTVAHPWALVLAHTAQIINALAGPLVLTTPSQLSETWFAPGERTTATATSIAANFAGSGVGFLLALPVKTPEDFQTLLRIEAVAAAAILVLCVVDFRWPAEPPLPPSVSASMETEGDTSVVEALTLLGRPQFLLVAVAYGFASGTYTGWSGALDPILAPLGYTQSQGAWLGLASTCGVIVGSIGFARVADAWREHGMKRLLLGLYFGGLLCFAGFTVMANRVVRIPNPQATEPTVLLYAFLTLGSLLLNATCGLFCELAVETVFPVSPVTALVSMTISFNIASGAYLIAGAVMGRSQSTQESVGRAMNWILLAAIAVGCALLMVLRERRLRTAVDEAGVVPGAGAPLVDKVGP